MQRLRRFLSSGPARLLAAGILSLGFALGCSDGAPTTGPNASSASADESSLPGPALDAHVLGCAPEPALHREAVVGPEGGSLQIGPHRLTIPAGALSEPVLITADRPADSVSSVVFGPEGLQFAPGHPAQLTLSYASCSPVTALVPHSVAYTSDGLQILQLLSSSDDPAGRRVSAELAHFSRYAVAW